MLKRCEIIAVTIAATSLFIFGVESARADSLIEVMPNMAKPNVSASATAQIIDNSEDPLREKALAVQKKATDLIELADILEDRARLIRSEADEGDEEAIRKAETTERAAVILKKRASSYLSLAITALNKLEEGSQKELSDTQAVLNEIRLEKEEKEKQEEIEEEKEKVEAEQERQRALQFGLADVENAADAATEEARLNLQRKEAAEEIKSEELQARQRELQFGLADVENAADAAAEKARLKLEQKEATEESKSNELLARQRELQFGLADVENAADAATEKARISSSEESKERIMAEKLEEAEQRIKVDRATNNNRADNGLGEKQEPKIVTTTLPPAPTASARPKARSLTLSDILIEPLEDFNLLPNRKNARQVTIRTTGENVKVRVIGERKGMYRVELHKNGVKQPGTYFISKKWAHRSLNFNAALAAINALDEVNQAGKPPGEIRECAPEVEGDEPVNVTEISRVMAQEVVQPSSSSFKPGCDILESRNELESNKEQLKRCFKSIKTAITQNARNGSGQLDRNKLYCNMYKNLRPEEQHFAGLMFTSVGEAGIITKQRMTPNPKYQEQLFVMKTMDNRLRQARTSKNDSHLNALDISLAHMQFSMYNHSIFPKFRTIFEPGSRAYESDENNALNAFISFQTEPEKLSPASKVDNVDMYFNPHGMTRIADLHHSRRAAARNKVNRLISQGKIPADYPTHRIAPSWDFDQLEMVPNIAYDGVEVRKTRPYMHVFYRKKSGNRLFYGDPRKMPPRWRTECGK